MNQTQDDADHLVVFLSGDLIFASRVKGAAERAGLTFMLSGSLPTNEADRIRYVILDLSTRSSLTSELVQQCGESCPQAKVVAYGPHVQAERLKAAREAGIPSVLTRGQFDATLATMFAQ